MSVVNHSAVRIVTKGGDPDRSDVRLHPAPEQIVQTGMILPVVLSVPRTPHAGPEENSSPQRGIMVNALLDTGATTTSIDESLAKNLGLVPIGFTQIGTAAGIRKAATYVVDISFPDTGLAPKRLVRVSSCNLQYSAESGAVLQRNVGALIGRDILSRWIVVWNGPMSTVTICD